MARSELEASSSSANVRRRRAARQQAAADAGSDADGDLKSTVRPRTRAKGSGKRNGQKAPARRAPAAEAAVAKADAPLEPLPSSGLRPAASGGATSSDTRLRFQFASLLRVSDNIVSRAVQAYDRLFALDQRDQADIYLDVGRRLADQGKSEQALEALRKAANLRPGDVEVLTQVGLLHLRQQAPAAAERVFERAKQAGGVSYDLSKGLADALMMQEKYAAALEELERALEHRRPVAEDLYQLGTLLDRIGRYPEAVEAFRKAIDLDPHQVAYHQSLGFTLESMGRRREAIKCFKRALELERPANVAGAAARG